MGAPYAHILSQLNAIEALSVGDPPAGLPRGGSLNRRGERLLRYLRDRRAREGK